MRGSADRSVISVGNGHVGAGLAQLNGESSIVADRDDVHKHSEVVQAKLHMMNLVNRCNALHRLARMATKNGTTSDSNQNLLFRTWLQQVKERLAMLINRNAQPQCLSTMAWSCAKLQVDDADIMKLIGDFSMGNLAMLEYFESAHFLQTGMAPACPLLDFAPAYVCMDAKRFADASSAAPRLCIAEECMDMDGEDVEDGNNPVEVVLEICIGALGHSNEDPDVYIGVRAEVSAHGEGHEIKHMPLGSSGPGRLYSVRFVPRIGLWTLRLTPFECKTGVDGPRVELTYCNRKIEAVTRDETALQYLGKSYDDSAYDASTYAGSAHAMENDAGEEDGSSGSSESSP